MIHTKLPNIRGWQLDMCGLALCALVTAGIYGLGMAPLWRQQNEHGQRRQQFNDQVQQSLQLKGELRGLTNVLATARKELADHPLNLQPANRVNQRISEVTAAAGDCGLMLAHVQPLRASAQGRHAIVPIELSGAGTFRQVLEFLRRLHALFGDSGVASLELSTVPTEAFSPISFNFRVHWYVAPATASAE